MEMRKCENGHYYDASVNMSCPYCGMVTGGATMPLSDDMMGNMDSGKTLPLGAMDAGSNATMPLGSGMPDSIGATLPLDYNGGGVEPDDDGRTVAIIKDKMGIDPVVGWLVCINGEEKGRDYRIHADNNFIGRSERMDICIRGDETISRENHAIISYDMIDKIYYFSPGDGRSIVRYNGKALFQTTQLNSHDHIIIGKTELVFVPFCTEDFTWSEEEQ